MLAHIFSAAVQGVEAFEIEIEVNAAKGGDPCVIIVGLPDAAVKESKDRVTTAIANSGCQEIADNEFNLNIPRYVDTFEEEAEIDLGPVKREIATLEAQLADVRGKMAAYLEELAA